MKTFTLLSLGIFAALPLFAGSLTIGPDYKRPTNNIAADRYRAGVVSYLEVVDANREALQAERGRAQLTGQRLTASVQLVKALGGGWTEGQLFAKANTTSSSRIEIRN